MRVTIQRFGWRVLLGALLVLALAGVAWAQGGYTLLRYSAEHSGALATGGGYTLVAATGQADAGGMSGDGFELAGGFITGAPIGQEPQREMYFPLLEKSP